jgi:hypothetical protein
MATNSARALVLGDFFQNDEIPPEGGGMFPRRSSVMDSGVT